MYHTKGTGLLLFLALSAGNLCAEEGLWYEHPREHLIIIHDTVAQHLEDTIVDAGDTMRCYFDVTAIYPIITAGPSQAVIDSLNGFISNFVMKHFDLPSGPTVKARVTTEVASLHTEWEDSAGEALAGIDQEAIVEYCDHRILSLKYVDDNCISCNGSPYSEHHYHFALPSLLEIAEDGLFVDGSRPYLDSIGELAFRKEQDIPPGASLTDSGFFREEDGEFSLSSNFVISDSGITYVFNPYTIASGARGMSSAHLAWSQLRPVVRADGPLGWVLKEE